MRCVHLALMLAHASCSTTLYLRSVRVILQHSTLGMPSKTKSVRGDSSVVTRES